MGVGFPGAGGGRLASSLGRGLASGIGSRLVSGRRIGNGSGS